MTAPQIKILLVDDEPNITKALRRLFMQVDQYDILTAASGADGLQILENNLDIGVVISDQRMPQMTGVEFLAQARKLTPDAVRILLTGYADIEASINAINKGAVFRYLTKPWNDQDLLEVVAEAVRSFQLIAENERLNKLVAKQNLALQQWNSRLKQRVLDQTAHIRAKGDALAESHQQLRSSFRETIEALSNLIEIRDRRTSGHSHNVTKLATAMAAELQLDDSETEKVRSAALLHDIGKIGLPEHLLGVPPLQMTEKDLGEYRLHPIRGQAAIDMVPALRDVGVIIRHHHEHVDGSGFPDELRGRRIPFGSRIICVADTFERALVHYPERTALESALREISPLWGKKLDTDLRIILETAAPIVFNHLDISAEVAKLQVKPRDLKAGMQLLRDLYSGTGVMLLNKGTIFDETAIALVKRRYQIDPFDMDIPVLVEPREK
ncbi:HD domain-containing phosphohydrolase [Pelovirga terrestris]|uniref:Response regulator n=1 Tax=Pelovirga terrestris TaxID=2771352 RepID=A0A8J6QQH9_9BACT|nr:HD domain-containing phosphohydrolase [Pelovirga terrestris]MBD1401231.1 response regulator [Pelovirga terrestris]